MDRIATFQTFIARNPADPFPRYGLAMEHKTRGELELARAAFQVLLDQFPTYVPTYLMAGGTLAALGQVAEAAAVYERGIEVSGASGDSHARKELESALAELQLAPVEAVGGASASLKPEERFR
jgi:tetratricopeptide (TPR) repeat protein